MQKSLKSGVVREEALPCPLPYHSLWFQLSVSQSVSPRLLVLAVVTVVVGDQFGAVVATLFYSLFLSLPARPACYFT